jgi:hypothetical protein
MYDDSTFNIGTFEVRSNIINASGNGIKINDIMFHASYIYDNADASFGNFLFNDNTIIAGIYGINVYRISYLAYETYGFSIATFGNFEFNNNNINSTNHGMYLSLVLTDCGKYLYDNSRAFLIISQVVDPA